MNWRDSRLQKILAFLSDKGVRGGLKESLKVWADQQSEVPEDVMGDYGWVLGENSPARLKAPHRGPLRLAWLIPNVNKGSGGLFNIFRTIKQLEEWGHQHRIYVVGRVEATARVATQIARNDFFPIESEVDLFTGEIADSDCLIATSWQTAYRARGIANTARKFYYVQDLESHFHAEGSLREFAQETCRWGFYGITAGQWIADVLRQEFGMECSTFGFSYDRHAYAAEGRRRFSDGKRRVLFYARPKTERRGFELGVLALSIVAKKLPEIEFVLVGFPPRPVRLPFRAVFPGILPLSELGALYRSCEIALVLSHTNLSLLPLELMASGCAIVSNSGPNVEWLLKDDTVQLAQPNPQALADGILALLDDESLRKQKVAAGLRLAQGTEWTKENRKIEEAFYQGMTSPNSVSPV